MRWIITKLGISILFSLVCLGELLAGNSQYVGIQVLSSSTAGGQIYIQEPNWSDVTNSTRYINRQAFIKLIYTRDQHTNIKADANTPNPYWGVRYIFEVNDVLSGQFYLDTLTIEHENDTAIYEAMAVYPIQGGNLAVTIHKVQARQGFGGAWATFSTTVPSYLPANEIELRAIINVDRYDYLSPTLAVTANHFYTYSATAPKANHVNISWSHITGMESSELEYVYWDGLSTDNPGLSNPSKLFAHATRVETNEQNYKIDLTYPQGTLYYRVRPVGRHLGTPNNDMTYRKEGAWSSIGQLTVNAFESDKSWQYTTAFAEEGKSKKSISYFDESMRNRQSVVFLNDDQRTLVAETDYSVEGQQSLGILPVPASPQENNLFFKPAFNVNTAGQPYSYLDFDKSNNADPLGNISGAGHYYSTANSFTNDLYRDYIHQDAYPFTQTKFTRDNTGRKAAQGGIGHFFQLGSQHETKYFYGSASDVELRRLFGSNVGNAQHYDKNMVIDANGQVAITYADQTGKTIATALAGRAPSNVEALPSAGNASITVDLIRNTTPTNGCIDDEASILNVEQGTVYDFSYNLTGTYNSLQMGNVNLCDACRYRLEITIRNTDDEYILPSGAITGANAETIIQGSDTLYRISQDYTGQQLASCSTGTAYTTQSIDFQMTFNELGSYRINKRLCLVSEPLSALRERLLTSGALPDSSAYIQAAYALVDTTICDFLDTLTSGQRTTIVHEANTQYCESALLQIKQQVMPGGAFNIDAINTINAMPSPPALYSIIDINGMQYWMSGNYIADAAYNAVSSVTVANNLTGGTYIINNQASMDIALQTTGIFQDAWADVLRFGHRENCHYWECQNLIPTKDYDFQLLQYNTWVEAASNGLTNYTAVLNNDPITSNVNFASCNLQPTLLGLMNNFRQSGQDIIQYTASAVGTLNTASYGGGLSQSGQDSLKWMFFRGFYQDLRDSLLEACTSCTWYDDANTIFRRNGIRNIETATQANDWNSEQLTDQYEQTCAAQVENWMQKFTQEMRLCGTYWNLSSNDSVYVRGQLAQYCAGNCDLENPMGVMLLEDVATDLYLHNALVRVNTYFSNMSAPCDMNWYNNTLQAFDSVYTWAMDTTTGQYITVCTPSCTEAAFISDLTSILNNQICTNASPSINANTYKYDILYNSTCFSSTQAISFINGRDMLLNGCEWVWMEMMPSGGVCNPYPNTYDYNFLITDIDSFQFLGIQHTSNACISSTGSVYKFLRYVNGNASFIYLAPLASGCQNQFGACTTSRVATMKPVDLDILSWNDVHQACINSLYEAAFAEGMNAWNAAIDSLLSQYMRTVDNCWLPPMNETFTASYISSEYHYTLYYYDQAGNLVQTISPEGVRPLTIANGVWDGVSEPQHGLLVTYQFNTLGQTIRQTSPDGGTTVFYHDDLKRLRLSQNAEQAGNAEYAFISYDNLNRPVKSGKLYSYTTPINSNLFIADLNNLAFPTSNITEVTNTYYGYSANGTGYLQENLFGRISHVSNGSITTYYSYDEIGNVKRLWHDIAGMGTTVNIAYQYDLVSGKVNQVDYQKGYQDQFSHRYNYDADNRLRSVETSADGYIWNREAKYQYYVHGQLARVELGDKVAGNDHYYNIQGWILGVNAMGDGEFHLGKDGQTANGTLNRWVARDAYSYQLAYYHRSYLPIGNYADYSISNDLISQMGTVPAGHTGQPGLYNGNISGMVTQLADGMLNGKVFAETFTYDQLHRIIGGVAGISTVSTDMGGFESYLDVNISNDFGSTYGYDANGNIKKLARTHLGHSIDELSYTYNQLPSGMLEHNRLQVIDDAVGSAGVGDLGSTAGGYTYDAIGRLVEDPSEYIRRITWNIQDKVTRVQFTNGNPDVEYAYDVQGNRLMKNNGNTLSFYVRDAQGNVLAIYEKTPDGMIQKEVHLYGSSRLGSWHTNRTMNTQTVRKFNYTRGRRTYEQSNHLGNVLTTITDLAHGVDDNADKIAEYYEVSIKYSTLYYPFGWEIPALTYSATPDGNRYGFNGVEKSPELGSGHNTTFYREMDTRIARWWAIDPVFQPFQSPYNMMDNGPILYADPLGNTVEPGKSTKRVDRLYKKASKLEKRMNKRLAKMDQADPKFAEFTARQNEYRAMQDDINFIRSTPLVHVKISEHNERINGELMDNGKPTNGILKYEGNNNMNITLATGKRNTADIRGTLAHELVHVRQYANADISYLHTKINGIETWIAGALYDLEDEVEANKRGYAFSSAKTTNEHFPGGITSINANTLVVIKPDHGNIAQKTKLSATSPFSSYQDNFVRWTGKATESMGTVLNQFSKANWQKNGIKEDFIGAEQP